MKKYVRLVLGLLTGLLWVPVGVTAAEFELRQDLAGHINGLRAIYRPAYYADDPRFDLPANRAGLERPNDHEPGGDDPGYRIITLSGVIEKGDAAKLDAFVEKTYEEVQAYPWLLVLDSPGGNFLEGIAIGKWLGENLASQDPSFMGSYVLKGDSCLSACSLIFALSSHRRMLNDSDSARFIEVGGRVGFHMGAVPENMGTQQAQVNAIMDLTYDIVAAYLSIIIDETSPPELLQEALKHRTSESFFYAEASDRAYNLGFIPVAYGGLSDALSATALPMSEVEAMCTHLLEISQEPLTIVTEDYGVLPPAKKMAKALFEEKGGGPLMASFGSGETCLIGLTPAGNLLMNVTREPISCIDKQAETTWEWCATDAEVSSFATTALLADVNSCQMGRFTGSQYILDGQGYAETPKAVVLDGVNMRDAPSLKSNTIGALGAGAELDLLDCAVTDDNQAVWLKGKTDGQEGWVSARFVRMKFAWEDGG
ncbi:SH3 domain-containing protein [Rhizobium sp. L1K21]|uniref:SH3 domain-containing protein n=1 Tax=Rhizobium sp. L1K21 TaxID=2954933 RepID=UPI0020928A90|nr:SH3 domain-containing protein [Rhizobium sp. L1K21]MCO6184653.1 SH3 domain-containing protein [Rhizobium sp. L1K21]